MNLINKKKGLLSISLFLCFTGIGSLHAQDNFTVYYNGISKTDKSPHVEDKDGNIGIKNPERGFSLRAGVIDFNSTSDYGTDPYYENISSNFTSTTTPLATYLSAYEDDGISLVETEVYVNYKDSFQVNSTSLSNQSLNRPQQDILPIFHENGLKAHLILNSSFSYQENDTEGQLGICEENDVRYNKNLGYLNALTPFFEDINPYTAVVHLGWISNPWLVDEYRLSSHWRRTNYGYFSTYPTGAIKKTTKYQNHHNTFRESTQRSSWGQIGNQASVWFYQSGINKLKKEVIDHTLNVFPSQKILLKSTMAIGSYIGTKLNYSSPPEPITIPGSSLNPLSQTLRGPYETIAVPAAISHLKDNDGFLRFGYYDHAFGGETYDHYWTIGNSSTQNIQWNSSMSSELGDFWGASQYFTDSYNLRKYRTSLWNHGEMPVYETEDTVVNTHRNPGAWGTSSFNMNFSYFENWYERPFNQGPNNQNNQYDYEIAEGISSGRLQDGFFSALKLRYFNYTSFNITHNNELDGRSPYEMEDGFTIHTDGLTPNYLVGSGIPQKENTAIQGWKNRDLNKVDLENFGMPISDRYFEDQAGNTSSRTAYEYIRDHLGYRLELQSTHFNVENELLTFNTKIINRGFTVPQNKRSVYFVLLDSDNNVINSERTNYDWRNWEPDAFSVSDDGADNLVAFPQGSSTVDVDNMIIGGIPLGSQNSNWFRSPVDSNYQPFEHVLFGSFKLGGLPNGKYKLGIVLPDNDENLYSNSDYSVKFANQVGYLDCQGITILGSVLKGNLGISDNDEDGIENSLDPNPYNPIDLKTVGVVPELLPCGLTNSLDIKNHPVHDISNANSLKFVGKKLVVLSEVEFIKIVDVQGRIVEFFDNTTTGVINLAHLTNGVYFIEYKANGKDEVLKIVI